MRRNAGLTVIELIIVVVLIVVVAIIAFPVFVKRPPGNRKVTCLSNVKQIVLACIMYAQDYDEMLPMCVADDRDGTTHAVGGVYTNWKISAMRHDVSVRYGEEYLDGRWMWQLPDLLSDYVKSLDIFECPTLVRQDRYFTVQTYVVGAHKRTGLADAGDPLVRYMARAPAKPAPRKVWQSGSYGYMCMHHPYRRGVWASGYGAEFMSLWDVANLLGFVAQPGVPGAANPQDYLACGNAVGLFANPVWEPLLMCRSFGVHEGYTREYAARHAIPAELAPLFGLTAKQTKPTVPVATPVAFVDGHVKYMRMTFYEMLALIVSPNKEMQSGD